jgi:hypothetical protein
MQMTIGSEKCKVIGVAGTLAVALAFMLIGSAPARAQGSSTERILGVPRTSAQPPATSSVSNANSLRLWGSNTNFLRLWGTIFDTRSVGVLASCNSAECIQFEPMFTEQVVCPVERGDSCMFQITIESQNKVGSIGNHTNGENGLYEFSVDGAAPTPGPVDANGCYSWSHDQPNSGATIGTSYAVTAIVKNAVAKQAHSVEVLIGCQESKGDVFGCSASAGLANLQVAVYTRN